jgi:hypothetical protein
LESGENRDCRIRLLGCLWFFFLLLSTVFLRDARHIWIQHHIPNHRPMMLTICRSPRELLRSARPWPFPNAHHVSCGRAAEDLAISTQVSVASDSLRPCLQGYQRPPVSLSCCLQSDADSYMPANTMSRYISADGNTTCGQHLIFPLRYELMLQSAI